MFSYLRDRHNDWIDVKITKKYLKNMTLQELTLDYDVQTTLFSPIEEEVSSNYEISGSDFMNLSGIEDLNCSFISDYETTNCTNFGRQSFIHAIPTIVMQVCFGFCFLFGLIGNSLVIYVILRFSKMQTVTNLYILNLAIADVLFVFGIPFLMTTTWLQYWTFGNLICKIFFVITSLNQFTSSLFLTIMSADRYIAVCHPINSPKVRTPMISKIVSLTAWITSVVLCLPIFLYSQTTLANRITSCNILWPDNLETFYTFTTFVLAFGIPVFLFFVFYSLVLLKLKTVGPSNKSKEKKKSHRKVTKMVLTVITVYVLCYLPYWVLQLILIFLPPKTDTGPLMIILFLFANCLPYANSAINPILYAFLSDNFKKSFMKACTCATRSDTNSVLQFETSVFPRRYRRDSSRPSRASAKDRKSSVTVALVPTSRNASIISKNPVTTIREDSGERNHKNGCTSSMSSNL